MEKGPRVVFKPDLEVQRGGDGGSTRLTSGGVVEGGRKEMTHDGSARGVGVGLYGARFNSNFELRSGKGFGPRCIVGRIGLKLSHGSGFGPRQSVGRQELQRGLFSDGLGKSNDALLNNQKLGRFIRHLDLSSKPLFNNSKKIGPVDRWASLFKRPFKSKLVAIKNSKWVQKWCWFARGRLKQGISDR